MSDSEDFVPQTLDVSEPERKQVTLEANNEWRFEVGFESKVTVRLIDGTAEVFGTELASGREYEFSGQNAAIFTYHGCKFEWEGDAVEYVAANPTMLRYANIHFALEKLRSEAAKSSGAGPRVMILGPKCSGKSSLVKILVSYAVKMGRSPLLVNLDTQNPVLAPPGSLTASSVSHILDFENGFGLPPINGPASTQHKQALVYNYGLETPTASTSFYENELRLLASGISERLESDESVRTSGAIIDTPSVFSNLDSEEIAEVMKLVISELHVDYVLVISKERLAAQLERESAAQVFSVPQSGGVIEVSDAFTRQLQRRYISQYFFGTSYLTLSPFTVSTSLTDIVVYRPIENNEVRVTTESGNVILTKVEPSAVLQNCLLAVVNAEPTDPIEVVQNAECLGYVHIVEADEQRRQLKILMPVPGKVPRKVYIMGAYRYVE